MLFSEIVLHVLCPFANCIILDNALYTLKEKWKLKVTSLSRVQLFATPWTVACQAPPSKGFSRQDHWSGLPFPSPGGSSFSRDRHWVSHIAGRLYHLSHQGNPNIRNVFSHSSKSESESHSVASNSLQPHWLYSPWNSPGQNTGVGSLSLLQGIFPTQGSNTGLQHCRRILYQLSHREAL